MSGERILVYLNVGGAPAPGSPDVGLQQLEAVREAVRRRWPEAADVQVWQADRGAEEFRVDFQYEGEAVDALREVVEAALAPLRNRPRE